jgi:threonine dehydrogenase-like Zn-dependent dehydrogenase
MLSVAVMAPGDIRIVDIAEPAPGPYQARVRLEAACLCNATDRKLIEGHFPGVEAYPLLLGHENAGIVEAIGEKVRSFRVGDRVIGGLLLDSPDPAFASGWGGFSQYVLAGDHRAMLEDGLADPRHGWHEVYEIMRVVPRDIPVEAAVLLCTWREVYAAFDDFGLRPGDDVLVFGGGPVGLSFVRFARLLGLGFVGLVDPLPEKRRRAVELGADAVFVPDDPVLPDLQARRGRPLDAVIDAVGRESIVNAALPLIVLAGSVCVYGVIDAPAIRLEKGHAPYNFNLLIHQWPTRWREAAAQEPLCAWIAAGSLRPEDFLTEEFPVAEVAAAFENARSGRALKTLLRF